MDSLTFKWKDSKEDLSEFVQYPAFGPEGDKIKISHMRIKKATGVLRTLTHVKLQILKAQKRVKLNFQVSHLSKMSNILH